MTESNSGGPAVEIRNLSRRFRTKQALDGVSFSVPRGCVFGLLGESGAGKTTVIRHLIGLLKPQQGTVRVLGMDPTTQPEEALGRIGYLSEDRDLPGWMRIDELMRYTQGLYRGWDDAFAKRLLERFDLQPGQKVSTLSRGQKAKTGLLVALAHKPDLLVLDEPSSGLDPLVRRHILSAVMRSFAKEGRTVLFSSHLLNEVERVSDYVAIIHRGKVLFSDRLEDILANHRKLEVRYDAAVETPHFDGAIGWEGAGAAWSVLTMGDGASVKQAIASQGGRIERESSASLEEVFLAHVGSPIAASDEF